MLLYNGSEFTIAAINTMPHGEQTISGNNFDGQFCLHLLGSKTHGTDTVNVEHMKSIKYAYKWVMSKI